MIEQSIFLHLMHDEQYFRTVFPHLKREYFHDSIDQRLFSYIKFFSDKYNRRPDQAVLRILLDKDQGLDDGSYESLKASISDMTNKPISGEMVDFYINEAEEFCKQRALFNSLQRAISIKENHDRPIDKRDKREKDIGFIPELLRDALSVCFDTSVGHNYLEDWKTRYDSYHDKSLKIPFDLDILNKITKGGVEYKTLNVILGGTNTGKSLGLCHLAASYLAQGFDTLYISMEMSEESVAKRIDANLLGIPMDELDQVPEGMYKNKVEQLKNKIVGRLYIKQYPTGAAHVGHFRTLLNELRTKQNFAPKIIIVDYLGIGASVRIGFGGENSYGYIKAIAEELRGLAIETDTCVWSAAQTTRGQWDKSDIDMSDVAESAGLSHTCDFMLGIVETDELAQMGQMMFKQVKSRYGDKSRYSKFFLGVDKGQQKWYEIDNDYDPGTPEPPPSAPRSQSSRSMSAPIEDTGISW